ncbi:nucleotidyltransferase family protein [Fulvimarina sp. 2208YS6-2-32]|uniref:Nucleotidyltransferase family protein n=1 Tax=Fulvimarina uroteuthidis TaxID=3098149 RepID=A0ABU5I6H0_9HYPH|nr:nucleotidyltransferase family protein [Fulvimarina sp. 2208YS6-2-32]MDY8110986.1 nucleotidyltransferase family protein [Fulvimarina sp. 2208YS6-2-32]
MKPSEALEKHRETIRSVLATYPVINPRVFGSVARGEDTEASDLDILVKLGPDMDEAKPLTLFDLARMEFKLQEIIGVKVDIRLEDGFSARMRNRLMVRTVPL